jgi:serine/threonine protein kinase
MKLSVQIDVNANVIRLFVGGEIYKVGGYYKKEFMVEDREEKIPGVPDEALSKSDNINISLQQLYNLYKSHPYKFYDCEKDICTYKYLINWNHLYDWDTYQNMVIDAIIGKKFSYKKRPKGELGSGSFGSVWLVDDKETGETFIMKEIKKAKYTDEEMTFLTTLSHVCKFIKLYCKNIPESEEYLQSLPNEDVKNLLSSSDMQNKITDYICKKNIPFPCYVDTLTDEKSVYIFTEYDGETYRDLDKFMKKNPIPKPPIILTIFRNLVFGLYVIHKLDIVHRDIKPQNIIINKNHNIQYIDFGLSCYRDDAICVQKSRGTALYMAPEYLLEFLSPPVEKIKITYDIADKADIWSLGMVFYEILTENNPFDRDYINTREKLANIQQKPLDYSDINEHYSSIIKKMLEINPHDRIGIDELYDLIMDKKLNKSIFDKPVKQKSPEKIPDIKKSSGKLPDIKKSSGKKIPCGKELFNGEKIKVIFNQCKSIGKSINDINEYILIPHKPNPPEEKYTLFLDSGIILDENEEESNLYSILEKYPELMSITHLQKYFLNFVDFQNVTEGYLLDKLEKVDLNDALLWSIQHKHSLQKIKYLINRGANVNAARDLPIVLATENDNYLEQIKYLVSKGANINVDDLRAIKNILDLLDDYKEYKKDTLKFLISKGADVSRLDPDYYQKMLDLYA